MKPDQRKPPDYDRAAVARVARVVEIASVDLVYAHFDRADSSPLPEPGPEYGPPEISFDYEWAVQERDGASRFGCIVRFGAAAGANSNESEVSGWSLGADFRVVYTLKNEAPDDQDLRQFVHFNVVFNAWPYWREYLSSTVNRAGLPRAVVPILLDPRALRADSSTDDEKADTDLLATEKRAPARS
jgi:hypothetical protein